MPAMPAPSPHAQHRETSRRDKLSPDAVARLAGAETLLATVCNDSGCALCIVDRDGDVLFANQRSRDWMAWIRPDDAPRADDHMRDTCEPHMLDERVAFVRRVCDEGVTIAYESVSRGMRHLVSLRPIGGDDGEPRLCLTLARRLRPWERVTHRSFPGAIIVHPETHDAGPLAMLSPREFEVLILIGQGHAYAEIAAILHRSVRTIERHRDRICHKIGAANRVDLARFAIRAGLAELPDPADAAMLSRQPYDPLDLSQPIRSLAARRSRARD